MSKLRFLTAGESHGPALSIILEGVPAGLELLAEDIDRHLARRQGGYGRGGRMKIEKDRVLFLAGVRHGITIGSPISLQIINRDYVNWETVMNPIPVDCCDPDIEAKLIEKKITRVRPGHADFAGAIKYAQDDVRNILERSSARETTSRVAAGAVALKFLEVLGIKVRSQVIQIGEVALAEEECGQINDSDWERIENSETRCKSSEITDKMKEAIDRSRKEGESLGGIVELIVTGLPVGLGSHVHWDRRLDGIIAQALMSVHTVKAVGFGIGFQAGMLPGSEVHDQMRRDEKGGGASGYTHLTNRAGGIEGGMTNGEPILCRVALKPIPTLARIPEESLKSVDLEHKSDSVAFYERSDICVVPAGGVVCEAMLALVLMNQVLEKFGGDSLGELKLNYRNYHDYCRGR
ncbi:MAG: chorismate synthase [Candidatus Caenarcaniphilales bacterium]|nr:chorismate synthase [Candidatus Caenarcaniphilales bacterium]